MSIDIDNVKTAVAMIRGGLEKLNHVDWHLTKLIGCYELLLTRFAPYQRGDKVVLTETPVITEHHSWGWLGGKHFLIAGAVAEVRGVEVEPDGFLFYLAFDNDSWIDPHTREVHYRSPADRSLYRFSEKVLQKD